MRLLSMNTVTSGQYPAGSIDTGNAHSGIDFANI